MAVYATHLAGGVLARSGVSFPQACGVGGAGWGVPRQFHRARSRCGRARACAHAAGAQSPDRMCARPPIACADRALLAAARPPGPGGRTGHSAAKRQAEVPLLFEAETAGDLHSNRLSKSSEGESWQPTPAACPHSCRMASPASTPVAAIAIPADRVYNNRGGVFTRCCAPLN